MVASKAIREMAPVVASEGVHVMAESNGNLDRKIEFIAEAMGHLTVRMDKLAESQEILVRSMLRMNERAKNADELLEATRNVVEHLAERTAELAERDDRLATRIEELAEADKRMGRRIEQLGQDVEEFFRALNLSREESDRRSKAFDERLGALDERLGTLAGLVERHIDGHRHGEQR
jgi:methyl-accepting chemotaxis protein